MLNVKNLRVTAGEKVLWDDLSFELPQGRVLGLSAPSGFGKTTLGRVLAGWQKPAAGTVTYAGHSVFTPGYCPVQLVAQHPEKSFNPVRTTGESLRDVYEPDAAQFKALSIDPTWLDRRPGELSGGELARLALLRALDPRTRVLIADEVTAQLDAVTQARVWQTLLHEVASRQLSLIVMSHSPALLEKVCDHVIKRQ